MESEKKNRFPSWSCIRIQIAARKQPDVGKLGLHFWGLTSDSHQVLLLPLLLVLLPAKLNRVLASCIICIETAQRPRPGNCTHSWARRTTTQARFSCWWFFCCCCCFALFFASSLWLGFKFSLPTRKTLITEVIKSPAIFVWMCVLSSVSDMSQMWSGLLTIPHFFWNMYLALTVNLTQPKVTWEVNLNGKTSKIRMS